MSSDSAVVAAWLAFNTIGQWSLLALLLIFVFFKHLPQRSNPFLINFIATVFIGTIPPSLLLYTGHVSARSPPSSGLCFAQAALVDGVPPLFGTAQVILLFDTWSELRSLSLHKRRISRISTIKYVLMIAPYMFMWIWVFASFIAAAQSKAKHEPGFAYCSNDSGPSNMMRKYISLFLLVLVMIELAFGLCIGWLLYRFPARKQKDPATWRSTMHFALRITILSFLQLMVLILSVGNAAGFNSYPVKVAYEILTSMNSLATFIAFGTQRTVLQAWKVRRKTKMADEMADGSELPTYSTDWSNPPRQQAEVFKEAFDHGQLGQATDGYFKPWLRVGETL